MPQPPAAHRPAGRAVCTSVPHVPGTISLLRPVAISSKQAFGSLGGSVAHCPTAQLRSQILQTLTRWAGKCSPSQPKTAALWEVCSHAGPGWHLGTWMLEGRPPFPGKRGSLCPHCCANDVVYAEHLLSFWGLEPGYVPGRGCPCASTKPQFWVSNKLPWQTTLPLCCHKSGGMKQVC